MTLADQPGHTHARTPSHTPVIWTGRLRVAEKSSPWLDVGASSESRGLQNTGGSDNE